MRFTAKERTGLQAMVSFARRYGEGPVSLTQVSREQGLPLPYLAHVVASLRRAGLLTSYRGVHGGYALTKSPSEVSVADVLVAIEGALIDLECLQSDGQPCAKEDNCPTRTVMRTVADKVHDTLASTLLSDVVI